MEPEELLAVEEIMVDYYLNSINRQKSHKYGVKLINFC